METLKTVVKCKKDLIHSDGLQCFSKGKTYIGNRSTLLEELKVINDVGEPHRLGNWSKHFKRIH